MPHNNQKIAESFLGDKDGVKVAYHPESDTYFIRIEDYALRNHTRFSRDLRSYFTQAPQWDSQTKSYVVQGAKEEAIFQAVCYARSASAGLQHFKSNVLQDIKRDLWQDIDDHERAEFNQRLQDAMAYRTYHPDEIAKLPPLPERYPHPVLKETYANTRDGAYSNGPVVAITDYFVVQYTSRGKLNEDRVSKNPEHWITLHSTDKFLHSPEDWKHPRQAIERAMGVWENQEGQPRLQRPWKSIEYNSSMKANVFEYQRDLHSPKARKLLAEQLAQSAQQVEQRTQTSTPTQTPEAQTTVAAKAAKVRLKEVHAELKEEVKEQSKAKPARSRSKKQTQSLGMTM